MAIATVVINADAEQYSPAAEPILTVEACGPDILMLEIGDAPESGHLGVNNSRSVAVRWIDFIQAWEIVRANRMLSPSEKQFEEARIALANHNGCV